MPTKNNSTQQFVDLKDVRENVLVLKNGQLCMVLLASSMNFALRSVEEQQAILQQFQNMLNTLDFSIQIYVQSRKLNIEPYLTLLASLESNQDNDLMRTQLREYMEFIKSFTDDYDVMSKNFFIIIPYSPAKLDLKSSFGNMITGKNKSTASLSDDQFEEHRNQLEQRVAIVEQGLHRVGVRTVTLGRDELVELFYHVYNPGDITGSAPDIK